MTTPLDISTFVYQTGTLNISPGDTTAVFSGSALSTSVKDGDYLIAGGSLAVIQTVSDDTHVDLFTEWAGSGISAGPYLILKASLLRYSNVEIGYDTTRFLSFLDGTTVWYAVEGDEPDPSIGENGQRALKSNVTPWKVWLKTGGVWVLQAGSPGGPGATILVQDAEPDADHPENSLWIDSDSADLDVYALTGSPPAWSDTGMNLKGATGPAAWAPPAAWVTGTAYTADPPASTVTQGGETYVCLVDHTSGTFATDLAADKWIKVAAKGADGTGVGDVVGPASATDAHIVLFDTASGKKIQDSGKSLSDLATAAQGAKADSAVQPDDLGSAATADTTDFATAAQGTKADSALQSIVEGNGIAVDDTDARNPIVSVSVLPPTVQVFLSGSGTYTTPAGVKWIEVELIGGGAGGSGGGSGSPGAGTGGGSTCWNTSGPACTSPLVSAGGGSGQNGGSATGSLTSYQAVSGSSGGGQTASYTGIHHTSGGSGGSSCLGGAGAGFYNLAGSNAAANSGSGGGGGGASASGTSTSGAGGGSGSCARFIINDPAVTYTYAVGAKGTGGAAGSNGYAGGDGGAGRITVIEHYGP